MVRPRSKAIAAFQSDGSGADEPQPDRSTRDGYYLKPLSVAVAIGTVGPFGERRAGIIRAGERSARWWAIKRSR